LIEDNVMELGDGGSGGAGAKGCVAGNGTREGVPTLREILDEFPVWQDGHIEESDGGVGKVADRVDAVRVA
jgi:hypothetical protein